MRSLYIEIFDGLGIYEKNTHDVRRTPLRGGIIVMVVRKSNGIRHSLANVLLVLGIAVFTIAITDSAHSAQTVLDKLNASTADHTKFEELQKAFTSGPEVTRTCLSCHTEAASQIQHTFHWTWAPGNPGDDCLGKARYLNNL